jgi:hypothetical protein
VSKDELSRFAAALDFLDVWNWKLHYDPGDAGYAVLDGETWAFKAQIGGRRCVTAGTNAYPAFENVLQTAIDPERVGLLVAAMQSILNISFPISGSNRSSVNTATNANRPGI